MSQRDWWKGDLIASALLVLLFGIVAALNWGSNTPTQDARQTSAGIYRDAYALCEQQAQTPWDVNACRWGAYERFYGTKAATAAWNDALAKRVTAVTTREAR